MLTPYIILNILLLIHGGILKEEMVRGCNTEAVTPPQPLH